MLTLGLEFTKVFEDSGSLTGEDGAKFEVTPLDASTKAILNGVEGQTNQALSGDATGFDGYTLAGLTKFKFALGNWKIHQTVVPEGTQPIQDIEVHFTPNSSRNGAPDSYTLSVTWEDGSRIYTKDFKADDFTNGNNNLINLNLGTMTDKQVTPPSIQTQASDVSDGDQTLGVGVVTGKDVSTIQGLAAGDYSEVTQWVDSKTGAPLVKDGESVTVTKDFTSQGSGKDIVSTEVSFNDAALQGKSVTAEEFVYPKGQVSGQAVVSENHFQDNPDQTLSISKATGETQVQNPSVKIGDQVKVEDTYKGTGFQPNQKATVKVDSAFDHSFNQEVPASGTATFTANSKGQIEGTLEVTVDTSNLQGHALTFLESAEVDGQVVSQLHDKNVPSETVTVKVPQPHKFDLKKTGVRLTNNTFLNDDREIAKPFTLTGNAHLATTQETPATFIQEVAQTAKNPAVDSTKNNQADNNNTLEVTLGQSYDFQLWLDTTAYDASAKETSLGMTEWLDLTDLTTDLSQWKVTGASDGKVLNPSLYTLKMGKANKEGKTPITFALKSTKPVTDASGKTIRIIDTSKISLGQYYKIDIPVQVKATVKTGHEITNTAQQFATNLDGKQWTQNTETRQNQVVFPSGHTQVVQKTIEPNTSVTYEDDYVATHLTIGQTYQIKVPGLWDKTLEQVISATGELNFKATASDMTLKVPVQLDASKLGGHDLVTFEDLYLQDQATKQNLMVAALHDKAAVSETIHVNLPVHTPSPLKNITNIVVNAVLPKTGDAGSWLPTGLGALLLAGLGLLKRKSILKGLMALKAKVWK